eukprot:gene11717-13835_t
MDVPEDQLQQLYTWVDEIPLSRPKRNIARDFSDGVLVAEITSHYFPKYIELHNYSGANGISQKMYNWGTLNQKVNVGPQLYVPPGQPGHHIPQNEAQFVPAPEAYAQPSVNMQEATIQELRETNEILETKVRKLEQLVRLKDAKVQTLMSKLQAAGIS